VTTRMLGAALVFALTLALVAAGAGCARSAPPLPGDSVASDGAVALSPPKFSVAAAPAEAPLGAVESKLFAPEVVMEHQGAIGIGPGQRDAILKEVERGQSEMLHLQWELNGDKEQLVAILDADKIDEAKATAQAARVMNDENRIKSAHLVMLVRVKNALSPEQKKKLRELRDRERPGAAPAAAKDGG
jgi:Spy/CpxP family protein refolding chaperone